MDSVKEDAGTEDPRAEGQPHVIVSRPTGPGKFEAGGTVDEWLHDQSMEGCDEELGDVEGFGWYGLLLFPEGVDVFEPVAGVEPESGGEPDYSFKAAIVHEDSQGFFDSDI
jgi:hypothetical protein